LVGWTGSERYAGIHNNPVNNALRRLYKGK
jgi:hypothetical protein